MNRKEYEKPTMRVVELKQGTLLLVGSGVESSREDYEFGGDEEW